MAFGVTLDYLVDDTGRTAEIRDKAMLQRLMDIEALEAEDKKTIVHVIDSLRRDAKAKKKPSNPGCIIVHNVVFIPAGKTFFKLDTGFSCTKDTSTRPGRLIQTGISPLWAVSMPR